MKTNLEKARIYFKKADFDLSLDIYTLDGRFEIEWIGEGEKFVVNENFYDHDVGYVNNSEMFLGDFDECLNYVLCELNIV